MEPQTKDDREFDLSGKFMTNLTYAELDELFSQLEQFKTMAVSNKALVKQASEAVESRFHARPLANKVARIGYELLGPASKNNQLARGALSFIIHLANYRHFNAEHVAYFADVVLEKVSDLSMTSYNFLGSGDKQAVQEYLEALRKSPLETDEELIRHAASFSAEHRHLQKSRIFDGMLRNIQVLANLLQDPEAKSDHKKWARAGLSYLVEREDVIPDDLGIVGFLDDALAVRLATHKIDPISSSIHSALVELIDSHSYMRKLYVSVGKGHVQPLSEFLLMNIGITIETLKESYHKVLLVPALDELPLLVGVGVLLPFIRSGLNTSIPFQLKVGQKVCLDNHYFGTYLGEKEVHGIKGIFVGFGKEAKRFLRLNEIYRLSVASEDAKTSKEIPIFREKGEGGPGAIERIFSLRSPIQIFPRVPLVLLVAKIGQTKFFSEKISLCGSSILESIPIGHYHRNGSFHPWSSRFPNDRTAIQVVSDLDQAYEFVRKNKKKFDLVIVDGSCIVNDSQSTIEGIQNHVPSTLVIVERAGVDQLEPSFLPRSERFSWDPDLLQRLNWPPKAELKALKCEHKAFAYNKRQRKVELVEDLQIESSWEYLQTIRKRMAQEEESEAYAWLYKLFWCLAFPTPSEEIEYAYNQAYERVLSPFVGTSELKAAEILIRSAEERMKDPQNHPTLRKILSILESGNDSTFLVASERKAEYLKHLVNSELSIVKPKEISGHDFSKPLVCVGWMGRKWMQRITEDASIQKLTLILNHFEARWLNAAKQRLYRFEGSTRPDILRNALPKRKSTPISKAFHEEEPADPFIKLDQQRFAFAHFVTFSQGQAGFFSPTHHFERHTDNGSEPVLLDDLQPGDTVLFHQTDSGLIRDSVDTQFENPEEVRQFATLWQTALIDYMGKNKFSVEQVAQNLKLYGCRRGIQTVRGWILNASMIRPRLDEDIDAIAQMTQYCELLENLEVCKNISRQLTEAHKNTGRKISSADRKVLRGVREGAIRTEWSAYDIESIDDSPTPIARTRINKLLSASQ